MMGKLTEDYSLEIDALTRAFDVALHSERYDPDSFGNGEVVLAGATVGFRIVRDRSEAFLDVRGAAEDWIDVRGVLGSLALLSHPRELHPIAELVSLVTANAEIFAHRISQP